VSDSPSAATIEASSNAVRQEWPMIALVNLSPKTERATGVECLEALPETPALRWSGFLVGCTGQLTVADVIQWCAAIREARPALPVGIVAPPDPEVLRCVASGRVVFDPVLVPEDVPGDRVPSNLLDRLRHSAVEGRVVERWLDRYGRIDPTEMPILHALAAQAVRGGRTKSVTNTLGVSLATLARRLEDWRYPPPGVLLRDGRITSVQVRIELGVDPRVAREAAGWYSAEMYAKARKRLRHDAKWGGVT
jgi:hypothetical protein